MSSLTSSLCASGRRNLILASRRNPTLLTKSLRTAAPAAPGAPVGVTPPLTAATLRSFTRAKWPSPSYGNAVRAASSSSSSSLHGSTTQHSFARPQQPSPTAIDVTKNNSNSRWQPAPQHHWRAGVSTATLNSSGSRGMASKAGGGPKESRKGGEASGATDEAGQGEGAKGGKQQQQEDEYDDADYEPEPEERVGPVKMVMGLCLLGLVVAAMAATLTELWPSHMAPQSIMSRAHDAFQADPDTANHFGTPLKVYGRDNNRQREGRRNFVEHVDHEDPVDNSKRSRVRFNVEGPHGHGMAYAEVSNKMATGEWVYLCVQDLQTGHVITLHDNRAMLIAQAQSGSDEEKNAFRKMLGQ